MDSVASFMVIKSDEAYADAQSVKRILSGTERSNGLLLKMLQSVDIPSFDARVLLNPFVTRFKACHIFRINRGQVVSG